MRVITIIFGLEEIHQSGLNCAIGRSLSGGKCLDASNRMFEEAALIWRTYCLLCQGIARDVMKVNRGRWKHQKDTREVESEREEREKSDRSR
jgi:hypothetical protein